MDNNLKNSGLVLVHSSNYNRWQYEQFQKYIGRCVLEIGCGLGNLTQYLLEDAAYLLSVDIKSEATDFAKKRFYGHPNFCVEQLDVFSQGLRQYADKAFDTIVFSNVLEHIEDDEAAMQTCREILRPSAGKLLLLIPAHRFLYGTLDQESGHHRRYTKKSLIRLANSLGFKIIEIYAFNFIGAVGWYLNYCLMRRKNSNNTPLTFQMGFYDRVLVKLCKSMEAKVRPWIGISYIMILEA